MRRPHRPTPVPVVRIQRVERRGWGGETGAPCPSLERCDASFDDVAADRDRWVW